MTQRAAALTAVMATDIASAVATKLDPFPDRQGAVPAGSIAALPFLGNGEHPARCGGAWCHSFYRQPHIANSRMLIAPPERISVAAMYSTYIQPGPAMGKAWASFRPGS